MKIALVYYSFSDNTHNTMLFLQQSLENKVNEVKRIRLKPSKEETSFFKQGRDAFLKKEIELTDCDYNLGKYDFIVFGTGVWAFTITPALRSYLNKVEGLENKKVGCFLTFGSGLGAKKALGELESILKSKGAKIIFSCNLQGKRAKDGNYLKKIFTPLLNFAF